MSIHPFLPRKPVAAPLEPYFSAEPVGPAPHLRPLSALEQMYAYWGSDRVWASKPERRVGDTAHPTPAPGLEPFQT